MSIGDPKKPPIRLSAADYTKLRHAVYQRAYGACEICYRWVPFNCFSLHHKKHRWHGDDTEENVIGCCLQCHNKKHTGEIKPD